MNYRTEYYLGIDLLRGVATILTVIGHSFLEYPVDCLSIPWCNTISHYIFSFHMPLFFVLAGFVWKDDSFLTLIKKKIIRLLVPYFFFGIIELLIRTFGSFLVNSTRRTSLGEGIKLLLFHGGGYWFLYVLFEVFLIFEVIRLLFSGFIKKSKWEICFLVFICLICIIIQDENILPGIFCLTAVSKYLPYFILGYIIKKCFLISEHNSGLISSVCVGKRIITILFLISVYFVVDYVDWKVYELCGLLLFIRTVAIIAVLFQSVKLLCNLYNSCDKKFIQLTKKFLLVCSKYSLQMYLFTAYCIGIVRVIECFILKISSAFITSGSILVVTIVVTLVVCDRILPHFHVLQFLCGCKVTKE